MFKVEVDPENLEVIARKIEKGVVVRDKFSDSGSSLTHNVWLHQLWGAVFRIMCR